LTKVQQMPTETYKKPRTILELKYFCQDHNIPAEKMHFFIGEDYRGPKAYGVYQDEDGHFIVYKNKADGTRVVRYSGPYEDIAVNELYEKMKAEVEAQRGAFREKKQAYTESAAQRREYSAYNAGSRTKGNDDGIYRENVEDRPLSYSSGSGSNSGSRGSEGRGQYQAYSTGTFDRDSNGHGSYSAYSGYRTAGGNQGGCSKGCKWIVIGSLIFFAVIAVISVILYTFGFRVEDKPKRGYYNYNDREYYYYDDDWYYYDDYAGDWIYWAEPDPYFTENYDDYYDDYSYTEGEGYSDFSDSEYYDDSYYSDYDDYNWDSDDYDYDYDWDWDDYDYDYDWDYDDYDYDYGDWDSDW